VFGIFEWQLGSSSCCAGSRQLAVINSLSYLGVPRHFHTLALHRISLITTHTHTHTLKHIHWVLPGNKSNSARLQPLFKGGECTRTWVFLHMCVREWCVVVVCSQVSVGLSSPWLSICSSLTMCCAHVLNRPVNQSLCRAASSTAVTVVPFVTTTGLVRKGKHLHPNMLDKVVHVLIGTYAHTHCGEIPACIHDKNVSSGINSENRGCSLPFLKPLWLIPVTNRDHRIVLWALSATSHPHSVWAELACRGTAGRPGRRLLRATAAGQNGAKKFHSQFPETVLQYYLHVVRRRKNAPCYRVIVFPICM